MIKLRAVITVVLGLALSSITYADAGFSIGGGGQPQPQAPDSSQAISAGLGNAAQLMNDSNSPVAGNPYGSVTLVEFFDYRCHHCAVMSPKVRALVAKNHDVRLVYKELPVRGEISIMAARAALAANLQGKFVAFHDALMNASEGLTEDRVMQIAASVGLNISQLKSDMNSGAIQQEISDNFTLAQSMGIIGTPAFFVAKTSKPNATNASFVMGSVDSSVLQGFINKAM